MLQEGVDITLPVADNSGDKPDTQDQTVVAIDAQSKLYVNMIPTEEVDVIPRLQGILERVSDKIVYLKGDTRAPYSAIMKMMDALRGAGIETVALITEKKGGNREGGGQ
jgi:biopolymer transport protein ExbD